jgi:hypothetical protein
MEGHCVQYARMVQEMSYEQIHCNANVLAWDPDGLRKEVHEVVRRITNTQTQKLPMFALSPELGKA